MNLQFSPLPALPSVRQTGCMTLPRKRLVSYSDTVYYHCIARCVRRAYLCGRDPLTGFDFEHRRQWIVDRMRELSAVFAIDLCAYAVMNNHYHVVLRINLEQSAAWTDEEVAERWCRLFRGPDIVRRWIKGHLLDNAQRYSVQQYIDMWRERLANLSWFMRCLNEAIARMANQEDGCTGRFWEGRFKSQALLDERALLACMAYVDLNPIRAAIARTPEQSEYTSIKERIANPQSPHLRPFSDTTDDARGIPYTFQNYYELVEWAGRVAQSDKRVSIQIELPSIVTRLGMDPRHLARFLADKQSFPRAIGPLEKMRKLAKILGGQFFQGIAIGRGLCETVT